MARKAIKDIESVEYKALDDWVLAYEAVSNLQMKDFGPDAKLADLQQHAGVAHSKGYNMELDQGRSFVRLHANASLRDMDLRNWIASSMPTSTRTSLDPASPQMGTVAARFGGDLGNYKVQLHGCFFNNSFFALMKGGATTKEQLKHVIKAFVDAMPSNKEDLVKKDDLELMAPVEKGYRGLAELLFTESIQHGGTFEDVAFLCSWHPKFKGQGTRTFSTDVVNGKVYADFMRESKDFWLPMVEAYTGRMAQIHRRKPMVHELQKKMDGFQQQITAVKQEPGTEAVPRKELTKVFQQYIKEIPEHKEQLGPELCKDVETSCLALLTTVTSREIAKPDSNKEALESYQAIAQELGQEEIEAKCSVAIMEKVEVGALAALDKIFSKKPASVADCHNVIKVWTGAQNLAKSDAQYQSMFTISMQMLTFLLPKCRSKDLHFSQAKPVLTFLRSFSKIKVVQELYKVGEYFEDVFSHLCLLAENLIQLTNACKAVLSTIKEGKPDRRSLLTLNSAYQLFCKDSAHLSKLDHRKCNQVFSQILRSAHKLVDVSIHGDEKVKVKGFQPILARYSVQHIKSTQAELERLEGQIFQEAYGHACNYKKPWHFGLKNDAAVRQDKQIRIAYDKHLNTLKGEQLDVQAEDLFKARFF